MNKYEKLPNLPKLPIYKDFADPADMPPYLRVKALEQKVARAYREVLAETVGGKIRADNIDGSRKEFIYTSQGVYRGAANTNSDNSTETRWHNGMQMTVVSFVTTDSQQVKRFLVAHHAWTDDFFDTYVDKVKVQLAEYEYDPQEALLPSRTQDSPGSTG